MENKLDQLAAAMHSLQIQMTNMQSELNALHQQRSSKDNNNNNSRMEDDDSEGSSEEPIRKDTAFVKDVYEKLENWATTAMVEKRDKKLHPSRLEWELAAANLTTELISNGKIREAKELAKQQERLRDWGERFGWAYAKEMHRLFALNFASEEPELLRMAKDSVETFRKEVLQRSSPSSRGDNKRGRGGKKRPYRGRGRGKSSKPSDSGGKSTPSK